MLKNSKLLFEARENKHRITCYTIDNPDQEKYTTDDYGNLVRPEDWNLWCIHAIHEEIPWDPENHDGYVVPEIKLTELRPDGMPQYPERWHDGARSICFFSPFKVSKGGIYQTVSAEPGAEYTASMWAHAWNSGGEENHNPHYSSGVGTAPFAMRVDDIRENKDVLTSIRFAIGIDPTGGTNPLADTVVWSDEWSIYNEFAKVEVTATAESNRITVFSMAMNMWRNIHNDRYMTDFSLVKSGDQPVEPPDTGGEYNYPVVERGTKLGVHTIGMGATQDLLKRVHVPVVKILTTKGGKDLWNPKEIDPDVIVIARIMEIPGYGSVEGWDDSVNPDRYMDAILSVAKEYPYVDYWELMNEQDPSNHLAMASFLVQCMNIAKIEGIRLAIPSYSMGVPEQHEWESIARSTLFFETLRDTGSIISLHAYGRHPKDVEWILDRHAMLEPIFEQKGFAVPVVLTEYNVDDTHGTGSGFMQLNPDELVSYWAQMDEMIAKQFYVLGACLFTFGGGGMWDQYNMDANIGGKPAYVHMAEYVRSVESRGNALPKPVDSDKYDSYVIVADPNVLSEEWLDMAYDKARKELKTVTPSHDDARTWPLNAKSRTVEIFGVSEDSDFGLALKDYYLSTNYKTNLIFTPVPSVKLYSQRDPRWASMTVGNSGRTMARIGCAVTSLAMLDGTTDPGSLLKCLNKHNSFTGTGAIYWAKMEQCSDLVFERYMIWDNSDPNMSMVYNALPALIRTRFSNGTTHFVLGIERYGDDILIADPWDGKLKTMQSAGYEIRGLVVYTRDATNVRGVHWAPVTSWPGSLNRAMADMEAMKIGWAKVLYDGAPTNLNIIAALKDNGVEPVVRLYSYSEGRNGIISEVPKLINAGAQYFEVMNEPNIEWTVDVSNDEDIEAVAKTWWLDAEEVINSGGRVAIPAMAPTERGAMNERHSGPLWLSSIVNWVNDRYGDKLRSYIENKLVWLAVHISPFNEPFTLDPRDSGNYINDFCLLYGEFATSLVERIVGARPFTISTEGGVYSPEHMAYITFPVSSDGWVLSNDGERLYNSETWGDYMKKMYDFMARRPIKIPVCTWTYTDEYVADPRWIGCGFRRADGSPRSPIKALSH